MVHGNSPILGTRTYEEYRKTAKREAIDDFLTLHGLIGTYNLTAWRPTVRVPTPGVPRAEREIPFTGSEAVSSSYGRVPMPAYESFVRNLLEDGPGYE
jgi:hypothetical protein